MAHTKASWFFLAAYASTLFLPLGANGTSLTNLTGVVPTVDLGYEIHQGSVNVRSTTYNGPISKRFTQYIEQLLLLITLTRPCEG